MSTKPKRPLSLLVCSALIEVASWLVPASQRIGWSREWQAEIWHRWQFLWHAGAWSSREAFLLLGRCTGAFPDALWHLSGQEKFKHRMRESIKSPWTCLAIFCGALLVLAAITGGFPATRNLLLSGTNSVNARLVFIRFHPSSGGEDEGLPSDVAPAWATRSHLLEGVAPFVLGHQPVTAPGLRAIQPLVVRTQPSLFQVLRAKPLLGHLPVARGIVLSYPLWESLFHASPSALGKSIRVGREWFQVSAVLPPSFRFLSRQPTAYLIQPTLPDAQQRILGRVKPGVSQKALDRELTQIAETACYYFFRSELRYSFLADAAWTPVKVFFVAALASALLVLAVSRVSLRRLRQIFKANARTTLALRISFFCAKTGLAFLFVFLAALEWSRSESAILYASRDPAAGPFLLWLYILGTMGVLFWAVADQRARCRVCLRLLCFPVRVGCPGCLLLNWSGTELLCSEGHGVLHVPHMTPSWDEESERWISLDESWKDLFAEI